MEDIARRRRRGSRIGGWRRRRWRRGLRKRRWRASEERRVEKTPFRVLCFSDSRQQSLDWGGGETWSTTMGLAFVANWSLK